jgi:predicted RNA-binding Zn ribbon-like protein
MSDGYRWSRVGGHLALDFCNTLSWRLDPARSIVRLAGPADLVDWFAALTGRAVGPPSEDPGGAEVLRRVRRLRAATIGLVDAHLDGTPGRPADARLVHDAWRAALAVAEVGPGLPFTAVLQPATAEQLEPALALAVVELLGRTDLERLGRCDGEGCGWLFLDTTRNHSRRWCDSLDCGNRARVRAYTKRRREHGGPVPETVRGAGG